MPPPPEKMRRIDEFAATVAGGILIDPENMQRYITFEEATGISRATKFAKDVYLIAKALLDESENF